MAQPAWLGRDLPAARAGERSHAEIPSKYRYYSDLAGPEMSHQYQTGIYLAGSASAEFLADIALCPFEAVKASASLCPCCPCRLASPPVPPARMLADVFILAAAACAAAAPCARQHPASTVARLWRRGRANPRLQVKVQTNPGWANGLSDGMPKFIAQACPARSLPSGSSAYSLLAHLCVLCFA